MQEDDILLEHVRVHGTRKWKELVESGKLPKRNTKACCNRFRRLRIMQRVAAAAQGSSQQQQKGGEEEGEGEGDSDGSPDPDALEDSPHPRCHLVRKESADVAQGKPGHVADGEQKPSGPPPSSVTRQGTAGTMQELTRQQLAVQSEHGVPQSQGHVSQPLPQEGPRLSLQDLDTETLTKLLRSLDPSHLLLTGQVNIHQINTHQPASSAAESCTAPPNRSVVTDELQSKCTESITQRHANTATLATCSNRALERQGADVASLLQTQGSDVASLSRTQGGDVASLQRVKEDPTLPHPPSPVPSDGGARLCYSSNQVSFQKQLEAVMSQVLPHSPTLLAPPRCHVADDMLPARQRNITTANRELPVKLETVTSGPRLADLDLEEWVTMEASQQSTLHVSTAPPATWQAEDAMASAPEVQELVKHLANTCTPEDVRRMQDLLALVQSTWTAPSPQGGDHASLARYGSHQRGGTAGVQMDRAGTMPAGTRFIDSRMMSARPGEQLSEGGPLAQRRTLPGRYQSNPVPRFDSQERQVAHETWRTDETSSRSEGIDEGYLEAASVGGVFRSGPSGAGSLRSEGIDEGYLGAESGEGVFGSGPSGAGSFRSPWHTDEAGGGSSGRGVLRFGRGRRASWSGATALTNLSVGHALEVAAAASEGALLSNTVCQLAENLGRQRMLQSPVQSESSSLFASQQQGSLVSPTSHHMHLHRAPPPSLSAPTDAHGAPRLGMVPRSSSATSASLLQTQGAGLQGSGSGPSGTEAPVQMPVRSSTAPRSEATAFSTLQLASLAAEPDFHCTISDIPYNNQEGTDFPFPGGLMAKEGSWGLPPQAHTFTRRVEIPLSPAEERRVRGKSPRSVSMGPLSGFKDSAFDVDIVAARTTTAPPLSDLFVGGVSAGPGKREELYDRLPRAPSTFEAQVEAIETFSGRNIAFPHEEPSTSIRKRKL